MGGSVLENKSCVDDRIACLWSFDTSLMKGFANSSNKFRRDAGSYDSIYKFVASLISVGVDRFNISNDSGILSCAS